MAYKPLKASEQKQSDQHDKHEDLSSDDDEHFARASGSEAGDDEDATPAPETFSELGVIEPICEACTALEFKAPTPIQAKAIPAALNGSDVIGLAQTGSGKTAAFSIPVLQALWNAPQELFACVLAPTRELAYQIAQQIEALGSQIQVRTATLVGGMDMMQQSIALSKKPHVVIATPGRLQDHLENTKGFSLRKLKYLVLDEADRLLDLDFGPIIDKLLSALPRDRTTMMFSATMTTKVARLQRASLHKPVRVEVKGDQRTADNLSQYYLFMPHERKEVYLVWLANENAAASAIVFTRTVADAQRIATLLRILGFGAIPLHGSMPQEARLAALQRFRGGSAGAAGGPRILVATDVAARGLDIPAVDLVVNYDLPGNSKDYIHRVGRTARAGRSGKAVSLVSQYDVELLQRIEAAIGVKLNLYPGGNDTDAILMLAERVGEAGRRAKLDLKDQAMAGGGGGSGHKRKHKESKWDAMDRDEDSRDGKPARGKAKPKNGKKIRQY